MNDEVKLIFDSNGNCLVLLKHSRRGSLLKISSDFIKDYEIRYVKKIAFLR
jgi:hypothetical protein